MKILLKDMEHVRQIYRQSPFVLVHPLVICAVLIIIPLVAVIRYGSPQPLLNFVLVFCVGVLVYAIRVVIIWSLNRYVVTNQRLLHYAQKGLFDQNVTETPHERILNVSYKTEGIISTMVGYGDVVVQVVGLMEPIILKNISMPMEIKDYLWDMHTRIASDKKHAVFAQTDATHIQERVGYSKGKQL